MTYAPEGHPPKKVENPFPEVVPDQILAAEARKQAEEKDGFEPLKEGDGKWM